MTQEEFYIWLLNCDSGIFPEFNSEFLKNYEIAKLVLDKFGIHYLREDQQANLNFEAVSAWFRVSEYIKLEYDIPKISELLPERFNFSLALRDSQIQSLPQLRSIGGWLDLQNSQIQSLPELISVRSSLDLTNSQIQTLPKLESVGWDLFLQYSQIQSLPQLKSVGECLCLENSEIQSLPKLESVGKVIYVFSVGLNYWKNYFNETGRPHLADKVR